MSAERVVLLVLVGLLAAALIVIYRLSFDKIRTNQTIQTLKEENEALRRNNSELKEQPPPATCPTCSKPPSCPSCPPPPEEKNLTCVKCGAGWEKHGGKCYYFSTNESSWTDSRRSCVDLGSDLVKIDSREEQIFLLGRVRDLMKNNGDFFWIGLTDSVKEGKWLWADGSPLDKSLSFWMSWEPDDWKHTPVGEDCARIGKGSDDLNTWFDFICDESQKSICEKPADLFKPTEMKLSN